MPYVTQKRRNELKPHAWTQAPPARMEGPGDLAYLLAATVADYLRQQGTRWQTINDVLGVLDGVGRDFWSQVGQPYEDGKRETNGGIY